MRLIRALTISLCLFGLMILFDYSQGNEISESLKLNVLWSLITGFGIEFIYPLFQRLFSKSEGE